MKIFAIYLPQFHSFQENDEWWGKGFTEWTNVKKAVPLFNNHKQPKIPENKNYYCLLDKSTVEWQTKLLKEYHLDGFAYYHYYFNGKLLMEKPAENLLRWKEIDQPFFFYWANHSWNRAWEGKKTILIEQKYGDKKDWEKHFLYLLPFFKDERYEKKNNKPLFAIFKDFKDKNKMFSYFNKRCIEEGFNGIYLIETYSDGVKYPKSYRNMITNRENDVETAIYVRQPNFSQTYSEHIFKKMFAVERRLRGFLGTKYSNGLFIKKYSADRLLKKTNKIKFNKIKTDLIYGLFFSWDNTPRHKYRGTIIKPIKKETFFKEMKKSAQNEYTIVNAWNEWAEGMMLEPTMCEKDKYLSWIKEWVENNNER